MVADHGSVVTISYLESSFLTAHAGSFVPDDWSEGTKTLGVFERRIHYYFYILFTHIIPDLYCTHIQIILLFVTRI